MAQSMSENAMITIRTRRYLGEQEPFQNTNTGNPSLRKNMLRSGKSNEFPIQLESVRGYLSVGMGVVEL